MQHIIASVFILNMYLYKLKFRKKPINIFLFVVK